MSIARRFSGLVDRLRIAHYRRSQVTQQILDERAEMELDFAREHIMRPPPPPALQ
jgi:hypothetical protein